MAHWTVEEIRACLAGHREELGRFSVQDLQVFGSVVRGEFADESDLDFLVRFHEKTFDNFMELRFFLEDLFSCRIDLVTHEALRPELREAILAEAVNAA
jgi:predicted nucleotidyltransferase